MKVIKIGAAWCSGCLVMGPRWEEIEQENPWLKTEYLDYDKDQTKIKSYKIHTNLLPTFIFFSKNGKELARKHGEISKKELVDLIKKYRSQ